MIMRCIQVQLVDECRCVPMEELPRRGYGMMCSQWWSVHEGTRRKVGVRVLFGGGQRDDREVEQEGERVYS